MEGDGISGRELIASQVEHCNEESRKRHAVPQTLMVVDRPHQLQLNNAKLTERDKMIFVIGCDETMYLHPKIKEVSQHFIPRWQTGARAFSKKNAMD